MTWRTAPADTLFVAFDDARKLCAPEDLGWLDRTLSLRRQQYRQCFVYMHVPPVDPRPGSRHALPADDAERLMAVLRKHDITAIFAGHIHSYLETAVDGIPLYITGGAGGTRDEPLGPHHYLLCEVREDGRFDVRKVDVDEVTDNDYLEYALRAKFPAQGILAAAVVLLLAGVIPSRRAYVRACRGAPGPQLPERAPGEGPAA
ncbi:MAG: hypothetical protein AMK73_10205 [Planctomycetes bacterium SM23_32]|nr:MAG: hypothetical protein AMK73_10205 [Planctomycetes bacterium SM23_32]